MFLLDAILESEIRLEHLRIATKTSEKLNFVLIAASLIIMVAILYLHFIHLKTDSTCPEVIDVIKFSWGTVIWEH